MPSTPDLKLALLDANGDPLDEAALVTFRNMMTGAVKSARSEPGKTLNVRGLDRGATGLYRVEADPAGYLASGKFVSIPSAGADETMRFAIDPRKVVGVEFPSFTKLAADTKRLLDASDAVSAFDGLSGTDLYAALDDIRKAGLLNITTKSRATPLLNGRVVGSYFEELRDLRGDRFFCVASQELRDEVKNATPTFFSEVSGSLHHPPAGFSPAGSYKTLDRYGNLQLTFFASNTEWVADVDIDNAQGLEHVFQVLHNELTGRPTHPYDIREILMVHQQLDTGYRFDV
ncbi:MAG TPA: hypothetical protein VES67_03520 [Vicinamibacterales bacterium]|nr:hypothetical protein [Vicinamibacterales bacterium]